MKRANSYRTKQRELILDCLIKNQKPHATVNDIIDYLEAEGTVVGKTTVYRTLDKLANEGLVCKYSLENGESACFEYVKSADNCHEHFHLKCVNCGKLIHLECDYMDNLHEHILNEHHFEVNNFKTVLYGQCEQCTAK